MSIFKDIVKWTKGEDDEDDFEEFTPRNRRNQPQQEVEPANAPVVQDYRKNDNVVNIHAPTQLSVVLVKPERFENAAEIADHLRDRRTVVLNLEDTNKDIARRLIAFLSGVTYSLEGKIKKVANNTFIITPYTVDIMGDLIDELENNGLYI